MQQQEHKPEDPTNPAGPSQGPAQTATEEAPKQEERQKKEKTTTEEFKISGDQVVGKIKELVHQGNIRRILIKNEEGKTLIEIPLALGLVGAAVLPVWAAVGAIAAMAAKMTIAVEKRID